MHKSTAKQIDLSLAGYTPGKNLNKCMDCEREFEGSARSRVCKHCAKDKVDNEWWRYSEERGQER